MDPFRNPALQSAKLQSFLRSSTTSTHRPSDSEASIEDMPAPPAYHMVVDPDMPIPNMRSPYEHEEEEEEKEDEVPEITINAATQIRGHGNIISIAQMDSVRIANLITSLLSGEKTTTQDLPSPPTLQSPPVPARPEETSRTEVRGVRRFPNVNITVNCGATIIGDRNIVGPGLGDIARQMQMAQRNQAMRAQQAQQQAQQQQQQAGAQEVRTSPLMQRRHTVFEARASIAQNHGVPTPPMSRSSSLDSNAERGVGVKRKAGEDDENIAKRQC